MHQRLTIRRVVAACAGAVVALAGCSGAADSDGEDRQASAGIEDTESADENAPDTSDAAGTSSQLDEGANVSSSSGVDKTPADADGLFDSSVVHDVKLSFDQADYDAMIEQLAETGEKDWIEVTATIDGVTYEAAGARLKGNSSLAGLSGGRGGGPGGGGPGGAASADEPEGLPWLIRLDKFAEDQEHLGFEDIVIRSNNSETSLNEAVALDLLEEAGLASQQSAYVAFSVNDSPTTLRLMVEHPDDDAWQDASFDGDGALYKAESTGDWSYRGDDLDAYDEVFDQEGGSDVADLKPLIEFLEFINDADDETFADELPERLDVESFATYLAMMDLIGNTDDIDGPGNNAYVWWDADTEQFTIVPWDMNLAFGGLGGFGGPGGFERGGGPRGGFEPPDDAEFPERGAPGGFQPGGGGRGSFGRTNPLVERFHATDEFEAKYQEQLTELTESLFESGRASEILDDWSGVLTEHASDLVDADTVQSDADAILQAMTTG